VKRIKNIRRPIQQTSRQAVVTSEKQRVSWTVDPTIVWEGAPSKAMQEFSLRMPIKCADATTVASLPTDCGKQIESGLGMPPEPELVLVSLLSNFRYLSHESVNGFDVAAASESKGRSHELSKESVDR